VLDYLKNTK